MTAVTTFPGFINNSAFISNESDFDSFFDFSQGVYQSPLSAQSPTSKSSPSTFAIDPLNIMQPVDTLDERQYLPGPSHEYDRFRQQTGLPSGVNLNIPGFDDSYGQAMSRQGSFLVPNGFQMDSMGYNPSYPTGMDFAGPSSETIHTSTNFFPYNSFDEYIDPTAIDEPQPPVNRLFPGMHSQQAEQAKAEALARQEQQQLQQQMANQRLQQAAFAAPQQQLPVQQPTARSQTQPKANPVVEDKISRLLDQMRNNSNASSMDDDDDANNQQEHGSRSRKDEDDMDEDERLLASEEGKKLSSKERRQLRNKVSARAFRSRRKEYITQLEGEVAGKITECNELKTLNRQLNNQNAQLIQLTQNLLRHPAFASVLEDMSNDPSILAPVKAAKEVPAPVKQEQQNEVTHVGMTMIPESSLDFSMLNIGREQWSSDNQEFNFSQPQVFAVLSLPEEPFFNTAALSGKNVEFVSEGCKVDAPSFVERPAPAAESKVNGPKIPTFSPEERNDPSFALYVDAPIQIPAKAVSSTIEEASRMLENSLSGKASIHFNMVSTEVSIESVDAMFSSVAPTFRRLERLATHFF